MRKEIKKMKKVWKTLKTAFKWLFIIILIFLLLSLLKDFLDYHNFLIGKVQEQSEQINNLHGIVNHLQDANVHLSQQVQLEHIKVEHLQNQLTIKINHQPINMPVNMTVDDIKDEINPQLKFPNNSFVPTAIVSVLTIMKSLVFRVVAF